MTKNAHHEPNNEPAHEAPPGRRRGGLHTVVVSDGNGGHEERLIINIKKWKGYAAFALVLFSLIGSVAAVIRLGVQSEVARAARTQVEPPKGVVYKAMDQMANERTALVLDAIEPRFDAVETQLAIINTQLADHFRDDESRHRALKDELQKYTAEVRRNNR